MDRDAVLRGAPHGGNRIRDVRIAQACCRRPAVHEIAARAIGRTAPELTAAGPLRRSVHHAARAIEERERLLAIVERTGRIAHHDGCTAGHGDSHTGLRAAIQPVAVRGAVHRYGHARSVRPNAEEAGPAIAEAVIQRERVGAIRGESAADHARSKLHGRVAGARVRSGIHLRGRRNRHREGGVVGAAEVVSHMIDVVVAAGSDGRHARLIAVGALARDVGSGPIAAVALSSIDRGECDQVVEERRIEVDAPIAHEAVVRGPHVAHLEGPGAIELRAHQPGQAVQAFVVAARQRGLSVVGHGAIRRSRDPAVVPAGPLRVGLQVIVDRDA